MVITHKKLPPMQCYHIFSDTRDVYLSKKHYGSYSPQMVPTNPLAHGLHLSFMMKTNFILKLR